MSETERAGRRRSAWGATVAVLIATATALALSGCGGSGEQTTIRTTSSAVTTGSSAAVPPSSRTTAAASTHTVTTRTTGTHTAGTHTAGTQTGATTGAGTHTGATTGAGSTTHAARTGHGGGAGAANRKASRTRGPVAPAPTAVAVLRRPVALRSAPGHAGHVVAHLKTHTEFGSNTADPVVRHSGSWFGVISVAAGNGRVGWIPASAVRLTPVNWRIYISLAKQRITVLYGGRVIRQITTSTGVPGAQTPLGHFAVTDRLQTGVRYGPYGCCILALSAMQPLRLSDWDGGTRIAIHATDDVGSLGHPASHGCAHVTDAEGRWLLRHIPDGTPVVIAQAPYRPGRGLPV